MPVTNQSSISPSGQGTKSNRPPAVLLNTRRGCRGRVPQRDNRGLRMIGVIAQYAERRRFEQEMPCLDNRQTCNDPIRPLRDPCGRFATRTTVSKDHPTWPRLANVHGASAFVVAVVPLGQVRFDLCPASEPPQLGGLTGRGATPTSSSAKHSCCRNDRVGRYHGAIPQRSTLLMQNIGAQRDRVVAGVMWHFAERLRIEERQVEQFELQSR